MKISNAGLAMIKRFESLELRAYPDPGTGGKPWTIGWGTTIYPDGTPVAPGDSCTQAQAAEYLRHNVAKFEQAVERNITRPLTQNQFDALVSLCYNIGAQNFKTSALARYCNTGNFELAAEQFLRWNRAAGKVLKGLTKRRQAEMELFKRTTIAGTETKGV